MNLILPEPFNWAGSEWYCFRVLGGPAGCGDTPGLPEILFFPHDVTVTRAIVVNIEEKFFQE